MYALIPTIWRQQGSNKQQDWKENIWMCRQMDGQCAFTETFFFYEQLRTHK